MQGTAGVARAARPARQKRERAVSRPDRARAARRGPQYFQVTTPWRRFNCFGIWDDLLPAPVSPG